MRCYSTGGTSNHEHWRTEPDELATELSPDSQETCCTYNMLKLTRHLFCWEPARRVRRLLRAGPLQQHPRHPGPRDRHDDVLRGPEPGPLEGLQHAARFVLVLHRHGHGEPRQVRRQHLLPRRRGSVRQPVHRLGARLEGEGASGSAGDAISRGGGDDADRQRAKPIELALRIRVPYWATRGVDGDGQRASSRRSRPSRSLPRRSIAPGSDGDRVEVSHADGPAPGPHARRRDPGHGDVRPAGLGRRTGHARGSPRRCSTSRASATSRRDRRSTAPMLRGRGRGSGDVDRAGAGRPLTFRTVGVGQPTTSRWCPTTGSSASATPSTGGSSARAAPSTARCSAGGRPQRARRARTVDAWRSAIRPSEKEHGLKGEEHGSRLHTGPPLATRPDGGWFSYDLKVAAGRAHDLVCTYWGSDVGARTSTSWSTAGRSPRRRSTATSRTSSSRSSTSSPRS